MKLITDAEMQNPLVAAKVAELNGILQSMSDEELAALGITVGIAALMGDLEAAIGVEFVTEEIQRRMALGHPFGEVRATHTAPETQN